MLNDRALVNFQGGIYFVNDDRYARLTRYYGTSCCYILGTLGNWLVCKNMIVTKLCSLNTPINPFNTAIHYL